MRTMREPRFRAEELEEAGALERAPDAETMRELLHFFAVAAASEVVDRQNAERLLLVERDSSQIPTGTGTFTLTLPDLAARQVVLDGLLCTFMAANVTLFRITVGRFTFDAPPFNAGAGGFILLNPWRKIWNPGEPITVQVAGFAATNTDPLALAVWGKQQPTTGVIT